MTALKISLEPPAEPIVIKVGSGTAPSALAASLYQALKDGGEVVIHAIGHGAVGQACKAIPILNTRTINAGTVYTVLFSLVDMQDEHNPDRKITVTRFRLLPARVGG